MRRARLAAAGILVVAGASPTFAVSPELWDLATRPVTVRLPDPDNHRRTLPEGPELVVVRDGSLPLVRIVVAVPVGSDRDPPGREGLASLAGGLLSRAGAGELGADELAYRFDRLGAELVSLGGARRTVASLSVPTWSFDEGRRLFADLLARPRFEEPAADRSRAVAVANLHRSRDDPWEVLELAWRRLMLGGGHPAVRRATEASLGSLSVDDLTRFHRTAWRPEGMVIAVSGRCDEETLLPWARALAKDLVEPSVPADGLDPPPSGELPDLRPGISFVDHPGRGARVIVGQRLAAGEGLGPTGRAEIDLAAEILGGRGAISRLAGRLRTAEGLVYGTWAEIVPGSIREPGEVRLVFETDAVAVGRALELLRGEVRRFLASPPEEVELETVRSTLLARMARGFDTAEEVAGHFAEDLLEGRDPGWRDPYLDALRSATARDVHRRVRSLLDPDAFAVVIVGDWEAVAPALTRDDREGAMELSAVALATGG